MADIVTGTVSGSVDMTSLLQGQSDIRRDVMQEGSDARVLTSQSAFNVATDVANSADRIVANDTAYFIANQAARTQSDREMARAQAWTEASLNAGFVKLSGEQALTMQVLKATTELEAARLEGKLALQNAILAQQITADGAATRTLVNDGRLHDQNRLLLERHSALVEAHGDARFWQHGYGNSQFAAVTSQLNALGSQLQETRQGMVNFGSIAGAATQTSTSNNA